MNQASAPYSAENREMTESSQQQQQQQHHQQQQQHHHQQNSEHASLLQAASDNFRLNQFRDFLASSNANMLPLLQQGRELPLQLSLGAGIPGLPGQVPGGQTVDLNPLLNGLVARPQNNMDPLLLQQAFANASGNSFIGQTAPAASTGAPAMSLPVSSFLSLNPSMSSTLGSTQRARPTSQEVQNAIATIAAAGVPLPPIQSISAVPDGGHPPVVVYMDCDEESLSDYQCLLRKQVELFEATADDVQWNAQGRNKAIVLGQVGIRCRYCARLPTWSRARGAVYYSATLDGLYQAAQNMAKNHLCRHCRLIPEDTRQKLIGLRDCKRRAAGGKKYWAEGARVLGVRQYNDGLRFKDSTTGRKQQEQEE